MISESEAIFLGTFIVSTIATILIMHLIAFIIMKIEQRKQKEAVLVFADTHNPDTKEAFIEHEI